MGDRDAAAMISVLVEPAAARPGATIALEAPETHHLRVRRISIGARLRLLDGAGGVGDGVLEEWGGTTAVVRVERWERVEPPTPLHLLVAAGDRDRFGWLAEKCAEVGVSELVPLRSERTDGVAGRVRADHLPKLRRRAREAIKQSGAAWAPVIGELMTVTEAVARLSTGPRWLADIAGTVPAAAGPPPSAVAVGPEGGFTPDERAWLVRAGFEPIRLGPHLMRFETAAIAAAVLARFSTPGAVHE